MLEAVDDLKRSYIIGEFYSILFRYVKNNADIIVKSGSLAKMVIAKSNIIKLEM